MCLVGGLSCNEYFRSQMIEEFGPRSRYNLNVIHPPRPMLSVVEGAALLGVTKNYIQARVLSKTYGYIVTSLESICKELGMSESFIARNRYYNAYRNEYCVKNCFSIIAFKDEPIFTNQVIKNTGQRLSPDQSVAMFEIYCSDDPNPLTIEDGRKLAEFTVEYAKSNVDLTVVTEFHFHDTILRVFSYPKSEPNRKKEVTLEYDFF